ncbi:MAG: hypothetical protein WBF58_03910, partial [Xanthobacteraceae bacterium]
MFIVERRGFRLGRGFYALAALALMPAAWLTMHVHYNPTPPKERLSVNLANPSKTKRTWTLTSGASVPLAIIAAGALIALAILFV